MAVQPFGADTSTGQMPDVVEQRIAELAEAGVADLTPAAIGAETPAGALTKANNAAAAARAGAKADVAADLANPTSAIGAQQLASIAAAIPEPQVAADTAVAGDSISAGGQTDPAEGRVIPAGELIASYLGTVVRNPSVPGERMGEIAVRQGGYALPVTVPGGSVPATTDWFPVTVTATGSDFTTWTSAEPDRAHFPAGKFLGVTVDLRNTPSGWTMRRTVAATVAKPVPAAGGFFRMLQGAAARRGVLFSFGGRNGGDIIANTRRMIDYLTEPKRFILSNPLTGQGDVNATYPAQQAAALQALADEYDDGHYFDMRGHLIANGLAEEGITPTSGDQTDIANNTVPRSLRVDEVHPNAAGQRVIARKLAQLHLDYGFVDPAAAHIPGSRQGVLLASNGVAYRAVAPVPLRSATKWSMRIVFRATALGDQMLVDRSVYNVNSGKVPWSLQVNGTDLVFQVFGAFNYESSTNFYFTKPPFVAGVDYGLRIDWDATVGATLYSSVDGGTTWTQRQTITQTSTLYNIDSGVQIQVAGLLKRFEMVDGATTYIRWTPTTASAEDAAWELQNAAYA